MKFPIQWAQGALLAAAALLLAPAPDASPRTQEVDLDQFPKALRPYLESSEGLEGLEYSLTLQVALALGQSAERRRVGRDMKEGADAARENWNEILMGALSEAAGKPGGTVFGGGFFYDTGAVYDPEAKSLEVVRRAEFLLEPMEEDVQELLERRRLVYGMREGLSKDDAQALLARLKPLIDAQEEDEFNPWTMHAGTHLSFMSLEAFDGYAERMRESGTPFGTWEEFQTRVIDETAKLVIHPLRAKLADEVTEDRNFRYEGEYMVQVIGGSKKAKADSWDAPELALAASAADQSPALLIQVPVQEKISAKSKLKRVVIGMVVAGEFRAIYDGKLPFR